MSIDAIKQSFHPCIRRAILALVFAVFGAWPGSARALEIECEDASTEFLSGLPLGVHGTIEATAISFDSSRRRGTIRRSRYGQGKVLNDESRFILNENHFCYEPRRTDTCRYAEKESLAENGLYFFASDCGEGRSLHISLTSGSLMIICEWPGRPIPQETIRLRNCRWRK